MLSYSGSAKSLKIPTAVEGLTVVEIAPDAFYQKTSLESVDLPDTITIIDARALKDCKKLKKMTTHSDQ